MYIDSVFDGDHESAIIFYENMYMKNENRKIRAHFGICDIIYTLSCREDVIVLFFF